ncbi:MAG: hypothetical protein HXM02_09645 [[Eubacterium] sulci]|jgi:hypothetical protein|nr:hypothetical protein [[Eubacterium] sulci]
MKKLSINIPEGLGDVLSQEELKHVLGGMGSQGGLGSELGSPDHSSCSKRCNSSADCGGYCPHCATGSNMGGQYRCFAAPPADPADAR